MAAITERLLGHILINYCSWNDLLSATRVSKRWYAATSVAEVQRRVKEVLEKRHGCSLTQEKIKEFPRLQFLGCVLERNMVVKKALNLGWQLHCHGEHRRISAVAGKLYFPACIWDGKSLRGTIRVLNFNLEHVCDFGTRKIATNPDYDFIENKDMPKGLHHGWRNPIRDLAVCGDTMATLGVENGKAVIALCSRETGMRRRAILPPNAELRSSTKHYHLKLDEDRVYLGYENDPAQPLIRSWDINTGKEKEPFHCFTYDPEGTLFTYIVGNGMVCASTHPWGQRRIYMFDKATGKVLAKRNRSDHPFFDAVGEPHLFIGSRLYCTDRNNVVACDATNLEILWEKRFGSTENMDDRFFGMATDGVDLFVCKTDKGLYGDADITTIEIWNALTGERKKRVLRRQEGLKRTVWRQILFGGAKIFLLEQTMEGSTPATLVAYGLDNSAKAEPKKPEEKRD